MKTIQGRASDSEASAGGDGSTLTLGGATDVQAHIQIHNIFKSINVFERFLIILVYFGSNSGTTREQSREDKISSARQDIDSK